MKLRFRQSLIPLCALFALGVGAADGPELPEIDGKPIVAKVNGEAISLDRFVSELAVLHSGMEMGETKRKRQKPDELLERLINTRLILQEATLMGMGELPKFQDAIERYRDQALGMLTLRRAAQDLELDTGTVEARIRERVKELRLDSVRLENQDDAAELVAAVQAGGDFRELATRMEVEGKIASLVLDGQRFIHVKQLLPQIYRAAEALDVGEISPVVEVEDGFAVFVLAEIRYPDKPEVRELVEAEVWSVQRATATTEFMDSLIERHAEVDEELLESLDYEAEESGFSSYLEDQRPLVVIAGEEPVTVAQFTKKVQDRFFHGIEGAIESHRVNTVKPEVLYDILRSRVVLTEGRVLQLDQSAEYDEMLEEYEDRLLFGLFVEKVIDPDVRLDDTTLNSYLAQHADEYSSPEMMRVVGLAFATEDDATNARDKLSAGAEFDWIRRNGIGRLPDDEDPLRLRGELLVTEALPSEAREAVKGAGDGELRLCALPDGPYYVLRVVKVVPSRTQPIADAAEQLIPRVLAEQRSKLIEEWAEKIREVSEVEIFVSGDELLEIIGMPRAGSR